MHVLDHFPTALGRPKASFCALSACPRRRAAREVWASGRWADGAPRQKGAMWWWLWTMDDLDSWGACPTLVQVRVCMRKRQRQRQRQRQTSKAPKPLGQALRVHQAAQRLAGRAIRSGLACTFCSTPSQSQTQTPAAPHPRCLYCTTKAALQRPPSKPHGTRSRDDKGNGNALDVGVAMCVGVCVLFCLGPANHHLRGGAVVERGRGENAGEDQGRANQTPTCSLLSLVN